MSHHLTEHETNRRKAWVEFMIGQCARMPNMLWRTPEEAARHADNMLVEYDKRFKCPYAMEGENRWN